MITLSGLHHVACCPGSAALPRFAREGARAPTLGRAIHRLLQWRIEDYQPSLSEIAEVPLDEADAGRLAFLAAHLRLPVPRGALAEVPLGYWPDGSVRRVEGGAGRYLDEGQILSGTIDCMWAEPRALFTDLDIGASRDGIYCPPGSTAWVVDWKAGSEEHVPPIDRNWQLRGAAVLAARWTGATRVIPAICYVNAAECAEAVRAGRVFEGRWEVGAPLDAAALDAVEAEMRAVLARARGEGDVAPEHGDSQDSERLRVLRADSDQGAQVQKGPHRLRVRNAPPLILGPHCDHCAARGACPALAAEAVTLLGALERDDAKTKDARAECMGSGSSGGDAGARSAALEGQPALPRRVDEGPAAHPEAEVAPHADAATALTPARAAHLAGIIPALRRILDAAEVAVRAHVHATGAPLVLADGREYGPALEEVRSYRTRPTYEALAEVVGEVAADEAFVATEDRIKTALRGGAARLPRGAWAAFEEGLEARGAVVVGAREVFRKRWPAKPAEVDRECVRGEGKLLDRGRCEAGPSADREPARRDEDAAEASAVPLSVREVAPRPGLRVEVAPAVSRAPCAVCKRERRVTKEGAIAAHRAIESALHCRGSGEPPARATEQTEIG